MSPARDERRQAVLGLLAHHGDRLASPHIATESLRRHAGG